MENASPTSHVTHWLSALSSHLTQSLLPEIPPTFYPSPRPFLITSTHKSNPTPSPRNNKHHGLHVPHSPPFSLARRPSYPVRRIAPRRPALRLRRTPRVHEHGPSVPFKAVPIPPSLQPCLPSATPASLTSTRTNTCSRSSTASKTSPSSTPSTIAPCRTSTACTRSTTYVQSCFSGATSTSKST